MILKLMNSTTVCPSSCLLSVTVLFFLLFLTELLKMATCKLEIPKFISGKKTFEGYKNEILAWEEITTLAKKDRGVYVALTLPDGDESRIREQVFESHGLAKLKTETGLKDLLDFMETHLGLDDTEDAWNRFVEFDDYRRGDESMSQFLASFDMKYQRVKAKGYVLEPNILAFMLLRRATLTPEEHLLVMTGLNFGNKDTMYTDAVKSLKKFKGESIGCGHTGTPASGTGIKVEPPTFYTDSYGRNRGRGNGGKRFDNGRGRGGYDNRGSRGGFDGQRSNGGSDRRNWRGGGDRRSGGDYGGDRRSGGDSFDRAGRPINKKGKNGHIILCTGCGSYRHTVEYCDETSTSVNTKDNYGQIRLCGACGSFRHFMASCIHSHEKKQQVHMNEGENYGENDQLQFPSGQDQAFVANVVLFNGSSNDPNLTVESLNCALLDSCCTSNVCGESWMEYYIESLSATDKESVKVQNSGRIFQFGGETFIPSQGSYRIPAVFGTEKVYIIVDVIKSEIPLLLSRTCMKKLRANIDYENDRAMILGQNMTLSFTASGHHCVNILPDKIVDRALIVRLNQMSRQERYRALVKLHRQFAHPPNPKLKDLISDAGIWEDCFNEDLEKIHDKCRICKERAPVPPRPVVAFSMARRFNEVVAMDLKVRESHQGYILYLIDVWSRYTQAVYIKRKLSSEVIHSIMKYWIGVFGVMGAVYTDNGGEFNNAELRDVASILNMKVHTTAAECPFQNGLCERIHAVTDMILAKLEAQYPKTPFDVLLQWACMARNSLAMWNGFSSHQLVFGASPNLPNILTDNLPALEGSTQSDVFAQHLNALRSARKAFIESESDEKIRRALRSKVRTSEQTFAFGDAVYYKRDKSDKWLGPGRVVCQDGKVIFVRHGGEYYRASPNRLMLAGTEISRPSKDVHHNDQHKEDDPIMLEDYEDDDLINPVADDDVPRVPARENVDQVIPGGNRILTDNEPVVPAAVAMEQPPDTIRRSLRTFNKEHGASVYIVSLPRSRHNDLDCMKAKEEELKKLQDFQVYDEVENLGQTCISTRWILWEKGENKDVRARLVARGFEEDLDVPIDSPTVNRCTMRMMLAVSVAKNWTVKATDIKSAFLQGSVLQRDVYLKPPKEANVEDGVVWKLKRCLYGLNDAARKFYDSIVEELQQLGCKKSYYDPSLFSKVDNNVCSGILVSHIDDFLHAGDAAFDDSISKKLCRRFLSGKNVEADFKYTGYQIKQTQAGIILDQNEYVEGITVSALSAQRAMQKNEPLNSEEATQFRSLVGSLNWLVQGTRPDLFFQLVDLSTKFKNCTVADLIQVRKLLQKARDCKCEVLFPNLGEISQWHLVTYADASFANLSNGTGSCIGYVVFLVGVNNRSCPLTWKSGKAKRVVKSTLGAEAMAMLEGIEASLYLKTMLADMLCLTMKSLPITIITDHEGLWGHVYSTHLTEDRRLRIDLAAAKESLQKGEIQEVRLCSSAQQLADCLTKKNADGRKLLSVLQSGRLDLQF